ncbi:MAG: hypothetical protein JNJ89_15835 [Rubrivivax sp.]|nr:hypothetical protein [Rubrivivax sp.]
MLIVAVAWIYVAGMAALAEALSPQGTVLGALITFLFYGALPLGIVLYVMATPARKRALRRQHELAEGAGPEDAAATATAVTDLTPGSAIDPDGRGHATAATVAAKREQA